MRPGCFRGAARFGPGPGQRRAAGPGFRGLRREAGVWYNGRGELGAGEAADEGDEVLGLGDALVPMIFGRETRWKSSPTTMEKWC